MSSNRLDKKIVCLKILSFVSQKILWLLFSKADLFFSLQTILCQFSSIFFLLGSLQLSNCNISSAVSLGIHPPFTLLLLCFNCNLFVKWEGPFLNCQQIELVQSNTQNFPAFQHEQPVIQLSSCLQKGLNLWFFQDLIEISSRQDPGKNSLYNHKKAAHYRFYQCTIYLWACCCTLKIQWFTSMLVQAELSSLHELDFFCLARAWHSMMLSALGAGRAEG